MGVLPLQYQPGENAASLGLTGRESFAILGLADGLAPRQAVTVAATRDAAASAASAGAGQAGEIRFSAVARLDGPIDVEYYRAGGILPAVLRRLASIH